MKEIIQAIKTINGDNTASAPGPDEVIRASDFQEILDAIANMKISDKACDMCNARCDVHCNVCNDCDVCQKSNSSSGNSKDDASCRICNACNICNGINSSNGRFCVRCDSCENMNTNCNYYSEYYYSPCYTNNYCGRGQCCDACNVICNTCQSCNSLRQYQT